MPAAAGIELPASPHGCLLQLLHAVPAGPSHHQGLPWLRSQRSQAEPGRFVAMSRRLITSKPLLPCKSIAAGGGWPGARGNARASRTFDHQSLCPALCGSWPAPPWRYGPAYTESPGPKTLRPWPAGIDPPESGRRHAPSGHHQAPGQGAAGSPEAVALLARLRGWAGCPITITSALISSATSRSRKAGCPAFESPSRPCRPARLSARAPAPSSRATRRINASPFLIPTTESTPATGMLLASSRAPPRVHRLAL